METFTLYYDQKITTWERSTFNIKAETEEEALKKLQDAIEQDNQYEDASGFAGCETLYDTNTYLTPDENDGNCTVEITNGGETLWDNSINR